MLLELLIIGTSDRYNYRRQSNGGYMEMVAAMLSVVLGLPPDFDVSSL